MRKPLRRQKPAMLFSVAVLLATAGLVVGNWAGRRTGVPFLDRANADPVSGLVEDGKDKNVILAQRKRIMGRLRSKEQISRVATSIRPLVDQALQLPDVQPDLQSLARSAGMSVDEYRGYFAGKQCGDLLLESGGDPNARSSANAIGVAQFMTDTGQRVGLKVNLSASDALSHKIDVIEKDLADIHGTPDGWTRPAPKGMGTSPWSREQWIDYRKRQWTNLVAKRRQVDQRFDPQRSIFAQTRYLLKITRSFGGVDWALQAYHGGEGGVSRTLALFAREAGHVQLASRGAGSHTRMAYNDFYRQVGPQNSPAAFSYLFGRSDDHRYYWWKVLMAERALDLYARNPEEFERQWKDLQPGLSADAAYYPNTPPLQFADNAALHAAYQDGTLVRLPSHASALGIVTDNLAALDPPSAGLFKGLRPEAMGALLKVAEIYHGQGGREPLRVSALVRTNAYAALWNAHYPSKPLPPGIPKDPEFHSTGLCFDLQPPHDDWSRKVLEYSLGRLYDNLRISWRKERDKAGMRYHVVVNPEFKEELIAANR